MLRWSCWSVVAVVTCPALLESWMCGVPVLRMAGTVVCGILLAVFLLAAAVFFLWVP
jgi:hypothetical protein